MRLAIVNLTAGGLSGGYAKYLRQLLPRLGRDRRIDRVDVFVPAPALKTLAINSMPLETWPEGDGFFGFQRLRRRLLELSPDVVFIPTARHLDCRDVPVVTMVRNMEPLEVPLAGNSVAMGLRNVARAREARRACVRATRVIAVSNHVRNFLTSRWRIDPRKIGVVYHGVERVSHDKAASMPPCLDRLDQTPFVFTAGSIRPARGLEDLVEALGQIQLPTPRLALVIAGEENRASRSYRQRLIRRSRSLGIEPQIIWSGSLSQAEMTWCFQACAAFVMTSRAEACPNVALEAMSHGCLCVSVDRPPMPEVFGAAAIYYRAGDSCGLKRTLSAVLTGSDRSSPELREAAVRRASDFDWETTANRTVSELLMVRRPTCPVP